MKLLHVSYGDLFGGANKAAYSVHKSLLESGIDSKMLVMRKSSIDDSVIGINNISKTKYYKNQIIQQISEIILKLQKTDNDNLHSINLFPSGIDKIINDMDVDIVNLHWINCEMMSVKEISNINKPIVWTLADMWPYSGTEHYSDCSKTSRFIDGYNNNNRGIQHRGIDLDKLTWRRKNKYWLHKNINIIATSEWNANCANNSFLFKNTNIDIVPQPIDLKLFKLHNKKFCRNVYNLPQNKFLILFAGSIKDKRKGYENLKSSLKFVYMDRNINNIELVILGSYDENLEKEIVIKSHFINFLYDDISRVLLYNSVDLLLAPSNQENLSNTVMESLASWLPCVAFNIGGMPDLIDHNVNGYLAEPFNNEDFASGISTLLNSSKETKKYSYAARKKAEKRFSPKIISAKYQKIYNNILK